MHATHKTVSLQRQSMVAKLAKVEAHDFLKLLTEPKLFDAVRWTSPPHRDRLFSPKETLSMFLAQALNPDRSCQRVVNDLAIKRLASRRAPCSTHTGAYCQARQRLPKAMISALGQHVGQWLTAQTPAAWHWRGRPVRLVDGFTVIMPDTAANQAAFPQPSSQKPGLGFPQCRIVGLICLGSGSVLNAAISACHGKGSDEQTLLRGQLDNLARGEVLLGDAFFATYFLLCQLIQRGVDGVFEQNGARQRTTNFACGQQLGTRDHLLVLSKPRIKPDWMSQEDYAQAPASITVRELHAGGKTLVTTLLCPKQTSKDAIKRLYRDRWQVELHFRNIKTTLGMEKLRCKTPEMVEKEIWVYLLAYNLIRLMMAQAARHCNLLPTQISFKHTVQIWLAWAPYAERCETPPYQELGILISQQVVGNRPDRIEPRAIKQRAKPYPLLMKPRKAARDHVRCHGHPKKA